MSAKRWGQLELFPLRLPRASSTANDVSCGELDKSVKPGNVGRSGKSRAVYPGNPIPPGTLELCILGSGSGGNCAAVRLAGTGGSGGTGGAAILIDAGFGPGTTAQRMFRVGLSLEQIQAICLTHLDQDHFRPHWIPTLLGYRIAIHLHRWHLPDFDRLPGADAMHAASLVRPFDGDIFEPAAGLRVGAIRLAHDRQGTSGFVVQSSTGKLGYATDLGHVPDLLIERFTGVNLLAIESNYDPPMQLRSPRPFVLKRRIMGPAGHLSNQQSFEAVRRIVDLSPLGSPRHILLLHRSQQCNRPEIVRQVFTEDERIAGRIVLTHQRRPTRWFPATPALPVQRLQMRFPF